MFCIITEQLVHKLHHICYFTLCTDFGNDHTINDAIILALVFSFLLTLVFTFIVGFLCGVFFIKKCKKPDKATGSPTPQHIALYEEVSSRDIEQREKAVEFEQNIAYASINN